MSVTAKANLTVALESYENEILSCARYVNDDEPPRSNIKQTRYEVVNAIEEYVRSRIAVAVEGLGRNTL